MTTLLFLAACASERVNAPTKPKFNSIQAYNAASKSIRISIEYWHRLHRATHYEHMVETATKLLRWFGYSNRAFCHRDYFAGPDNWHIDYCVPLFPYRVTTLLCIPLPPLTTEQSGVMYRVTALPYICRSTQNK